jgi:hypothetical protein
MVTTQTFNPAAGAALGVLVGVHSSTPAQISAAGCKASWSKRAEFTLGDWGCCVFVGTGATTNEAITFSSSGEALGFEYVVVQISADGTLSFPANDAESTGTGTAMAVSGLAALANAANRVLSMFFLGSGDGVTPGTGQTEIYDASEGIANAGYVQLGAANDSTPDATAVTSADWGGGAFEIAESAGGSTGRGRLIGGKLVGGNLVTRL